ncbi:MAG: hypothetical protein AUJ60_08470 [Nitrospirae bacterium CG1_02_44_142]|nr:MAG: hypothetical protein AUJ60_08470 [Nitrospirae bacterium CG1_02_44_142]
MKIWKWVALWIPELLAIVYFKKKRKVVRKKMETEMVAEYLGKRVLIRSKKLSVSVIGRVTDVVCDVLILQGYCLWGIRCSDITEISLSALDA